MCDSCAAFSHSVLVALSQAVVLRLRTLYYWRCLKRTMKRPASAQVMKRPAGTAEVDWLICDGTCGKAYPRAHWSADILKKHRTDKTRKLVCRGCTDKGCSARDVNLYHCESCDLYLGHARFDKHSLYNKAKSGRRQAGLVCRECQSRIPCDACKKRYPKKEWPVKMLANQRNGGTNLVCRNCREKGCTAHDMNVYTCQRCRKEIGSGRFDKKLLENFKNLDRRKLICLACTKECDEKTRLLHCQFKESKIYCECGCLIHREHCPLVPRYYGERKWPGCDGCISAEDRIFLDELRPAPLWWRKAWHKY